MQPKPKIVKVANLPSIGNCLVREQTSGHYLWLSLFGWHDCSKVEDTICQAAPKKGITWVF